MFTLQSLMLVALGILLASLVVIAVLPVYRSRVQRLTADKMRRSVPLTEAEIRADKDKLRAQYAIRVHKLEAQGEQQKLAAARQRIEMNRRDARITELDGDLEKFKAALEENFNARRVLEHTVTDRLPRLEQQLDSARELIQERDQEMVSLKSETTRSVRALDDAMQMNAQQRAELERISSSVASRAPQPRDTFSDARFDGELALRSEIEALRAKTREQVRIISQLQSIQAGEAPSESAGVDRLKRELVDAEVALKAARDAAQSGSYDRAAVEAQAKALNAKIDEQAGEIARLNAALSVYEAAGDGSDKRAAAQGNRLASKARNNSLQVQVAQQTETIQRLRAELAASNERLARQAAHFMEEMRRLGAGTVPTTVDPRRGRDGAPRRSLSDRISQTKPGIAGDANGSLRATGDELEQPRADGSNGHSNGNGKVSEYLKALTDEMPVPPAAAAMAPTELDAALVAPVLANGSSDAGDGSAPPKRKLRLLERISGAGKA